MANDVFTFRDFDALPEQKQVEKREEFSVHPIFVIKLFYIPVTTSIIDEVELSKLMANIDTEEFIKHLSDEFQRSIDFEIMAAMIFALEI